MSLENLGMNQDPLVRTIFVIFLIILTSLSLVFWGLTFSHQQESSPKVVDSLQYVGAQIPDFASKFQNQCYSYNLNLRSQHLQPLWFVQKCDPARSNGQNL